MAFGIDDAILAGIAIAGATSGGLGAASKKKEYAKQERLNAVKASTMPWLGLAPAQLDAPPSILGSTIGGGLKYGMAGLAAKDLSPTVKGWLGVDGPEKYLLSNQRLK